MMQTLRNFAVCQLSKEDGPPSDPKIEHWTRYLITTGQVPDTILETLPEVSRDDYPQISPQEYECGCVTVVHVTDRSTREKPFEMRLAILCKGAACELAYLR